MRRWRTPIEVETDARDHPVQYWWRGHRWRVQCIEQQWFESGPWWQASGASALRGAMRAGDQDAGGATSDEAGEQFEAGSKPADDLHEVQLWRVEVVNGRPGSRAIHELSCNAHGWVLRAVVD